MQAVEDLRCTSTVCRRYGVSRQTLYNLQERFLSEGTAGLLAKKPGPKGPSKLTAEVRRFVERQIQYDLSAMSLLSQLEEQFDVFFCHHKVAQIDLRHPYE